MKIGLVAPPWLPVPPRHYGGTEAVVDRLARGFAEAGHDVVLYATGDSACPVETRWTYATDQMHRLGQGIVELRHVADAYRALSDRDVVHDHTVIGPLFAREAGSPPVVTTVHGPFDVDSEPVYRELGRSAAVVAISHSQRRSAPRVPVARVIHHGIDVDEFALGDGGGGYLLFLGRMCPDKGPHRAIEVARRAGLRLVVAGKCREPLEQAYFDHEVAPRLGPDTEWIGEVDDARKRMLLAGAVALVNPIRWREPFGLVMIEAMATGTPVLAFAEGAAPEIVEDGVSGYLCADEADMAARVPAVTALDRVACRQHVIRHFSTRQMVADHLDLYAEVVARAGRVDAVA